MAESHIDKDVQTLCTCEATSTQLQLSALSLCFSKYHTPLEAILSCYKQANRLANFTKRNCNYSCRQQNTILKVLSSASRLIVYPPGTRTSKREQTRRSLAGLLRRLSCQCFCLIDCCLPSISPKTLCPILPSVFRAECSDSGSKVEPVYLLRCQLQPNVMLLLLPRDRF